MVVVYAARRTGWRNGAARDAGLIYLVHVVPIPASGDQEVLSQIAPLHAEVAKAHGMRQAVRHGEWGVLELDGRLERILVGQGIGVRKKLDPALLPSPFDPLVAVLVHCQEVVPQFTISFRHLGNGSHVGELEL